jgi:hypothetical protein
MNNKAGKLLHDLKVAMCGEIVADLGKIPSEPIVVPALWTIRRHSGGRCDVQVQRDAPVNTVPPPACPCSLETARRLEEIAAGIRKFLDQAPNNGR